MTSLTLFSVHWSDLLRFCVINKLKLFLHVALTFQPFSIFFIASVNIQSLYCFQYTSSSEELVKSAGWEFFKLENEYKRMKVPNNEWQSTSMNKDYALCDTYPNLLFVPNAADKTVLLGSSRFRSKGRLPALTYLHPNKASISRCSQPLSGFSARCMEDEQMLQEIRKTNPNSSILYVVDTRPRVSFGTGEIKNNLLNFFPRRSTQWQIERLAKATRTNCSTKTRNFTFSASKTFTRCERVCKSSSRRANKSQ